MGKNIKVVLNSAGVREMLHKCGQSICKEKADSIASACGSGYASDVQKGKNRSYASVYTDDFRAMADNSKNNTILRNLR